MELPAVHGDTSFLGIVQIVGIFAVLLLFFGGYAWHVEHHVKVAPRYSLSTHIGHLISSISGGLLLIVVLDLAVTVVLQLLHVVPQTAQNQAGIDRLVQVNLLSKIVTVFLAVIVAPICEETIYRLLLIGPIKTKRLKPTDRHRKHLAVLSWAAFILAHMAQQIFGLVVDPSWNAFIAVITSSLIYSNLSFVIVREYYLHGSLVRSIAVHMSWNAIAAGFLLLA